MTNATDLSVFEPPPSRPRLLLALDCDGTLLDPTGKIRPRVRDAVRAAAEAGALVTLATGRRMQAATPFATELGIRTPLILQDGATVQDPITGALYHQDPLPPVLVARLIDLALSHGLHPLVQRITTDPTGDAIHVLHDADFDFGVGALSRGAIAHLSRRSRSRCFPLNPSDASRRTAMKRRCVPSWHTFRSESRSSAALRTSAHRV